MVTIIVILMYYTSNYYNYMIACVPHFSILKLKNDWGMRQAAAGSTNTTTTATKEQEVVMDSNAAYETVEMRYQLPATAQPQLQVRGQQHIEDYSEVVYDCPAS